MVGQERLGARPAPIRLTSYLLKGICLQLVNATRREKLSFEHLGLGKRWEWTLNAPAAAAATLYLVEHSGDEIAFVGDAGGWPFRTGSRDDLPAYRDVTREVLVRIADTGALGRLAGLQSDGPFAADPLEEWAPPE